MASEAAKLYQLQLLDIDIEDKQRQLRSLQAGLSVTAELAAARDDLAAAEGRRDQLQRTIGQLEEELGARAAKIAELQKRLFGGAVDKLKQAGALEKELAGQREDRQRLEDQVLGAMAESEELPNKIESLRGSLQDITASWNQDQNRLRTDVDRVAVALADQKAQRRHHIDLLSSELMSVYEELRRTRRGRAVAKVERNTCQGCRVALPMGEVQQARNRPSLSFCSFCGRILYVER